MSNSGSSLPTTDEGKRGFFDWFNKSVEWQMRVDEKLACKSLGLPMDTGINVRNGLGWKELAVVGAIGLGIWQLLATRPDSTPPPVDPPAVTAPHEDLDTTRGINIEPYIPTAADREKGESP